MINFIILNNFEIFLIKSDGAVVAYDKIHEILGNYTDHLLDDVSQIISVMIQN